MSETAADLARRLACHAENVCRHYLSSGRREGRAWRVGDVDNTSGRSLCVQLSETSRGAARRWIDFATGEHGDLLDLIARTRRLDAFRDMLDEARRFLDQPQLSSTQRHAPVPSRSPEAAWRLFASARPIRGTIAEVYLRNRAITGTQDLSAWRFHSRCWYRSHDDAPRETWPALIAAVIDLNGRITGVHRTWLQRDGSGKAPWQRRAAPWDSSSHLRMSPASCTWSIGPNAARVGDRCRQLRPRRRPRPAFMRRSGQKRLRPATAARGFLPLAARKAPPFLARQESRARRPSLALRPCRLRLWVQASAASGFSDARRPRWARPHLRAHDP